jgi:hypothetical protein
VTGVCRDRAGNASSRPFALKYDATPATVTGMTPGRSADAAGWYNRAVLLIFDGADQTSGVDSCTSMTYDGPDTAATSVPGNCTDRAGNRSAARGFGLKYETAPKATGVAPGHCWRFRWLADTAPDPGWITAVPLDGTAMPWLGQCGA